MTIFKIILEYTNKMKDKKRIDQKLIVEIKIKHKLENIKIARNRQVDNYLLRVNTLGRKTKSKNRIIKNIANSMVTFLFKIVIDLKNNQRR